MTITAEQVDLLWDGEVEALAEGYASSSAFREARAGTQDWGPVTWEPGEAATAYLDRFLQNEIEPQAKQSRKMMEPALGSTRGIFDQVRKISLDLADSAIALGSRSRPASLLHESPLRHMYSCHIKHRHHDARPHQLRGPVMTGRKGRSGSKPRSAMRATEKHYGP